MVRRYAPISEEQIYEIMTCGDVSTARIKIARLIHNETHGVGVPEMEAARLRRMIERRDEFIIANGLWDAFKEASREAE